MPAMPLLSKSPQNILLPRFDTLGDIVLFEGFLEALFQRFPEAKATLLIRRACADLSCLFPERLEWLITDMNPYSQPPDKVLGAKLIETMNTVSPDLVLATAHHRSWADNLVAANAKEAKIFAIGKWTEMSSNYRNVFEELGLKTSCPYEQTIPVLEKSQEADKYQILWEALTGISTLPEPKLYVNEHLRLAADSILQSMNLQGKSFCLCCPAGTQNVAIKAWSPDRFAETIAWLELERGVRCLVTGHRSEADCVEKVAHLAEKEGARPEIWLGRDGDIPLLAAFIETARLYLGNDTGPMHIASAIGTPVIGIFGGGTWPRFVPRGAKSIAIAGEMSCFGCGWDCIFGDAPCMNLVSVNDVKTAVDLFGQDDIGGLRICRASGKISDETNEYIKKAIKTHLEINRDRLARFEINLRLEKTLKENEADRAEVEADRAARLETIERLTNTLSEVEADRAARLETIERLTNTLSEIEADRAARLEAIERLTSTLSEVEVDRAARLETIERLTNTLSEVEADREARLRLIEQLDTDLKLKAQELEQTQDELNRIRRSIPVRILTKLHLIPH
jgi:ADP-heptose:LPS heptosyltransferase